MHFDIELGHNAIEATKNVCFVKGKGTVDPSTVTRWVKKFPLGCKNLNEQVRPCRLLKT